MTSLEGRADLTIGFEAANAWAVARAGIDRDAFISELAREGVGAGLHFTPVHGHKYYREKYGFRPGDLPHTEAAGEQILSLPLYPLLTEEHRVRVVEAVKAILRRHAPRG